VTISRPVEDVFAFYRDFTNLPKFLGDVMAIEPTGPGTTRWTIQGPLGIKAHWTMRVTEERANELIRYHLKQLLETGHVTDTSYAVSGKFGEDRRRGRLAAFRPGR
jgi:uncharacterized membrane protein